MRFTWEGRPVPFRGGDTVAVALWRERVRILSRSLRFHRPRAYFCGTGACNQCLVRVDGVPNVKACLTACADGARVTSQNAWPSAARDVWRLFDVVYPAKMDVHASFLRPRFLQPLYQRVIRAFAGLGRVPDRDAWREGPGSWAERDVDVLVVGGGPGGLAAARAASARGVSVALVEQADDLGGRVAAERDGAAREAARELAIEAGARADVHVATTALGRYADGGVAAVRGRDMIRFRPKALVLAPGTYENDALFPNNDLPGIMTAGAALRLVRRGVAPGRRVAVVGDHERAPETARMLRDGGIDVAALVSRRPDAARAGVPVVEGRLRRALGVRGVRGLVLDDGSRVRCDAVVLAVGLRPRPELFQQAGCALAYRPALGGFAPRLDERLATTATSVFAAGEAAGATTFDEAVHTGERAGVAAVAYAATVQPRRVARVPRPPAAPLEAAP